MREIKFRAKRIDNREWIYGIPVKGYPGDGYSEMLEDGVCDFATRLIEPATLGQFTGLKDRNGNDIFEGDIVSNEKYVGRVKWMPGKCCYQISPGGVYLSKSCEVLGNIYDNPELLKGGEQ